jgi:hypothetical protein
LNGNWQKAFWRILSNPTIEVIATIVLVLVLAWFVIQFGGLHAGGFVLFGR